MRVVQTSKVKVTYLDHVKRFQGFMNEARRDDVYTKELPVDTDSYAVVELQVRSIINGLDAIVTYKQKIVNDEGFSREVVLFQYPYKKDLATTQQMVHDYAMQMNLDTDHVEQIREIIPALMLQDMVDNNVYDLTADDWETEVK